MEAGIQEKRNEGKKKLKIGHIFKCKMQRIKKKLYTLFLYFVCRAIQMNQFMTL